METLYKGRYLIAIYDKDDFLVDVATNIAQVCKIIDIKESSAYAAISRGKFFAQTHNGMTLYLIDCMEEHNDAFSMEDELFLDFMKRKGMFSVGVLAKRLGVSVRTVYRWKARGKWLEVANG